MNQSSLLDHSVPRLPPLKSPTTMKFFILSLLAASAVASPALNRDDECPTLEQIGQAFEEHFQVEIPAGILDCVHGGENCPFSSFEAAFEWFEESTGLQVEERRRKYFVIFFLSSDPRR